MPIWVILSIVLGLVFGYFLPHQAVSLEKAVIPLLFIMIYVMVIPTGLKQFYQVIRFPKNVGLGIVFICILAPLIAYPLLHSIFRGYPEMGIGVLLAATVPPGGMIAAWTGLLEGDIPLAITLQAITLVLGTVQIPYTLSLLGSTVVAVPIGDMVQTLIIIVILPFVIGFASRWVILRRWDEKALRSFSPNFAIISGLAAIGAVFISAALKAHVLLKHPELIGIGLAGAVAYYLLAYFITTALCRLGRIKYAQSIPLVYGTGTKNLSIAIALSLANFPNTNVILGVIACFMIQMPLASIFYKVIPRILRKSEMSQGGTS
jgi:ACR3 family arsenite efflux pump ArsB